MVRSIEYRVGFLLVDEENDVWEITKIRGRWFLVKPLNEKHSVRKYRDRSICRTLRPFYFQVGDVFSYRNIQYTFHGIEHRYAGGNNVWLCKIKGKASFIYLTTKALINYS